MAKDMTTTKIDKQLQQFLKDSYSEIAKKILPLFKKSYENRVARWYYTTAESTNYGSILKSTSYRTRIYANPTVGRKNSKDRIRLKAIIDENVYANIHRRRIDRWSEKHSEIVDGKREPRGRTRLYDGRDVFDLQMNQGILGLPEYGDTILSNGERWVNPHFHKNKHSLLEYLGGNSTSEAANTSATNIELDIKKDVEKVIQEVFASKGIILKINIKG